MKKEEEEEEEVPEEAGKEVGGEEPDAAKSGDAAAAEEEEDDDSLALEEVEGDSAKLPRAVSNGVKKARKMMEEKKGCNVPVVNIPFVPQHR